MNSLAESGLAAPAVIPMPRGISGVKSLVYSQPTSLRSAALDSMGAADEPGLEDGDPVSALGDVRAEHVAVAWRLRGLAELVERGPALVVHVSPEGAVAEVVVDRVGGDLYFLSIPSCAICATVDGAVCPSARPCCRS